jgi:hypothetical protein
MRKIFLSLVLLPSLAFAQAVLPTSWNFSSPGVSTPPSGWAYNVGTNGNLTYAFGKGDALAGRLDATGENIVINFSDKPGLLTYYLSPQNAGSAWGGQFDIQESADGSVWTTIRSITSKSTTATNFNDPIYTDSLKVTSRWVRFYFTTKLAGGNASIPGGNMAVDLVTITAAPAQSLKLSVKQGSTTLVNGNTFVSGNAASTKFILQNDGTGADIHIDSIKVSGTNAADFTIGSFDSTITFGGGKDSFNVNFVAGTPGSRFAKVNIYTTDPDNSPFAINLYAIGGNFATEPATQVPSLSISGVKTHTLNVSFARATGAEHYIVLRKPASTLTEVPVDGTTYSRGDYIGGAQVAYIGDDTTQLKPNYILAKTNYTFTAFAYNGPAGYENYKTTTVASANTTTPDGQPGTYYNGINPSVSTFILDLNAKIKVMDTIFYSNYAPVMVNNYLARDTTGGKRVVNCVYTNEPYVYEEPFLWWSGTSGNTGILTREHTFAQSWMPTNTGGTWPDVNGKEVNEYHDLHHLFPAHQLNANAKRSNNPFGVVVNATYTAPTGVGKLGTDAGGKTVYEPKDDQKGDLARALFYMLVRYNGINGVQWRLPSGQDIAILQQWHQQDPPSPLEIARNEYISTTQKNRNPFIDHPEWVNRINFSNMTYIQDTTGAVGTISVVAPASNAKIVAGTTAVISWTSSNIDSVSIALQTSAGGSFKTIGTYAASLGSVSYTFNEPATNDAVIRIRKKSDTTITAISGKFKITLSSLEIQTPSEGTVLNDQDSSWVKWTKTDVDSVDFICYVFDSGMGSAVDSVFSSDITADSVQIPLLRKGMLTRYHIVIREKSMQKLPAFLAMDTINFSMQLSDGLAENRSLNNSVSVYPVPSNGLVHVNIEGKNSLEEIRIYDATGRIVGVSSQPEFTIQQQGFYFLHIYTKNGLAVKKVIIQ